MKYVPRQRKRKARAREEQPEGPGKKAKRLEKYIETKLKKEENQELLRKLAAEQQSNKILFAKTKASKSESEQEEQRTSVSYREDELVPDHLELSSSAQPTFVFGAGLKRPLDLDEAGKPIIKVRKRRKVKPAPAVVDESLSDWSGFSDQESGELQSEDHDIRTYEAAPDLSDFTSESNDEEESESEKKTESGNVTNREARASSFIEWATQQRNAAIGFAASTNIDALATVTYEHPAVPENFKPRPLEVDPLPAELQTTSNNDRKAFSMHVDRSLEIQEARLALPVVAEEQKIMEAVHNNPIVVVQGATGSGKTTQIPQFLYEAGYGCAGSSTPGIIGITQPRRVAAVSMAQRVAYELGEAGNKVAYQVRFDKSTMRDDTAIKFMTDGILLREMATDFLLSKYSAIVIDEAHERSVNTDILIGMLSRSVFERQKRVEDLRPLKLIIMSATFRRGDFIENTRLFNHGIPPTVKAEGRQYPVTLHFARQTRREYMDEIFAKISKGHEKLPPGGFLVFLTGQNEITALSRRLKGAFVSTEAAEPKLEKLLSIDTPLEEDDVEFDDDERLRADDLNSSHLGSDDSDSEFDINEGDPGSGVAKVHILPLYSQLNQHQQLRVFEPSPVGSRLIVLATNVAETSITIPGIRYVFDCGRAKEKHYDPDTGVQNFEIGWISKASAAQRAGRAGRTGPGHCYRLYSSAVFEAQFAEYTQPEILRAPLEGIVLQLKSMGVPHILNFPFPTSPDKASLVRAEKLLLYLGAISEREVTKIGHELAAFPLNPRYARMIYEGKQHGIAGLAAGLVAAVSMPDLFVPENQIFGDDIAREEVEDEVRHDQRKHFNKTHAEFCRWDRGSDAIKALKALREYSRIAAQEQVEFCTTHYLRSKALREATQLHSQLVSVINDRYDVSPPISFSVHKPHQKQICSLKSVLATGFINNIAIRADLSPSPPDLTRKPKRAIDVPYITLFPSYFRNRDTSETSPFVFLHPSSVLAHTHPSTLPKYIVYSHLQIASTSVPGRMSKVRMAALTDVNGVQLVQAGFGTELVGWSKQVREVKELGQGRRECLCVPMLVGEKGRIGWPLPEAKTLQRRNGVSWVVEKII